MPLRDHVRATALPGLAGTTALPGSSALIVRAMAFRACLEPLIPSLRRARLDTGLPATASLLDDRCRCEHKLAGDATHDHRLASARWLRFERLLHLNNKNVCPVW